MYVCMYVCMYVLYSEYYASGITSIMCNSVYCRFYTLPTDYFHHYHLTLIFGRTFSLEIANIWLLSAPPASSYLNWQTLSLAI